MGEGIGNDIASRTALESIVSDGARRLQGGFNVASLSIQGSSENAPYDNAAAFRKLVDAEGTGSVNDLLREGYRLPSGPTSVPSPDAFRSMVQDSGINVYDIWYLDGPTPNNDPALEQMAQDIYLAY